LNARFLKGFVGLVAGFAIHRLFHGKIEGIRENGQCNAGSQAHRRKTSLFYIGKM